MPLHNWSRVAPEIFHDFHLSWLVQVSREINQRVANEGFYSLIEPIAAGLHKTVLDAEDFTRMRSEIESRADQTDPVNWANRLGVYREDGHLIRGFVEILTPETVSSSVLWDRFVQRTEDAISSEFSVAVMDAFARVHYARRSLHEGSSNRVEDIGRAAGNGTWLGIASFSGDGEAQLDPVSVGTTLPELPLFLVPGKCLRIPLEASYIEAWKGVPKHLKPVIEGADAN